MARVVANPADCNIDFEISEDGLQCTTLWEGGFAYCWSGARATVGIRVDAVERLPAGVRGFYFVCHVEDRHKAVYMPGTGAAEKFLSRIGGSKPDIDVGCLGETPWSFGFGGSGVKSTERKFVQYGPVFGTGASVACVLDLVDRTISFQLNRVPLGVAFTLPHSTAPPGPGPAPGPEWGGPALFPHVLLKNMTVRLMFSPEDELRPLEGAAAQSFLPWAAALQLGCAVLGPGVGAPVPRVPPEVKQEDNAGPGGLEQREVLMMVGLPGCGKTTWAEQWRDSHPEKRYVILGTDLILELMKVPGVNRKNAYHQRWEHLMPLAEGVFKKCLTIAPRMPRNFILDQTNVYQTARLRKLSFFKGFKKIAVVMVPDDAELVRRSTKRTQETCKAVPEDAINEMKANFILPVAKDEGGGKGTPEPFDEVWHLELPKEEAFALVEKYRAEGKAAWKRIPQAEKRAAQDAQRLRDNMGKKFSRAAAYHAAGYDRHAIKHHKELSAAKKAGKAGAREAAGATPASSLPSPCGTPVHSFGASDSWSRQSEVSVPSSPLPPSPYGLPHPPPQHSLAYPPCPVPALDMYQQASYLVEFKESPYSKSASPSVDLTPTPHGPWGYGQRNEHGHYGQQPLQPPTFSSPPSAFRLPPPPSYSSLPPPSYSSLPPLSYSSLPPPSYSSLPPSYSSLPPPSYSSLPPPSYSSLPLPSPLPPPSYSCPPPPSHSSLLPTTFSSPPPSLQYIPVKVEPVAHHSTVGHLQTPGGFSSPFPSPAQGQPLASPYTLQLASYHGGRPEMQLDAYGTNLSGFRYVSNYPPSL